MVQRVDIDHNALREWLVKSINAGDCEERSLAERVLAMIYESATDKQQEYISLFVEEGLSVRDISRSYNVDAGTVVHCIKRGIGNAYSALAAELPKDLFGGCEKSKSKNRRLPAEPIAEPHKAKIVGLREGPRRQERSSAPRRLYMSEEEIVLVYRRAENKNQKIRILAEMNVTTCAVIRKILRDRGVFESERKRQNAAQPI